jgi:tetratricopeptide (TPR) repeat protein
MAPDESTYRELPSEVPALPSRAGKYRIVGRIGQGGMGVVYRGVDDDLGRTVALKFLPADLGEDSLGAQRFQREARAASALDHVNIGTIFGVEETADHRRFIVMAYYEGRDLSGRIKDESQPLSPGEAISIAIQVARGLAEAHEHGVIHRDIKPSNILLTPQGIVKIVDFGLASMSGAGQLTMTGARMGTPAYMSPEQALGQSVDHRSDLWSLGVVLLEMLTRQRVFQADSMPATLFKVVHGEVPMLENVEQPLRSILARALAKDPGKRYQSAGDFLAAMETIQPASVNVRPLTAAQLATLSLSPAGSSRRMWQGWRIAAIALLAILSAGALYFLKHPQSVSPRAGAAGVPASARAFDKYMQGVDLAKRWDKPGNLDRAIALLTDATKSDPSMALGFAHLAEAQRIRYTLSRDKTSLDAAAKNAAEAVRLNPELAPVQVAFGRVQATSGNTDLAMASFEHALRIDSDDADANLAIGRQYERLGRVKDAEATYRKAITLEPDSLAAHDGYASFLFRQSRYADAIGEWQTVVRNAPDDAAAYVNLGSSLNETNRIAEAITMYQNAVKFNPTDMAYSNLGTAYVRTGHYPEAAAAYRSAIALTSNNYLVWGNLAWVYWSMNGMNDQTKQTFARAIALGEQSRKDNPRDAAVNSNLAQYYAKTGNSPLARQRIETALALSPKGPQTQADAAEVYELLGDRVNAVAFARKALALGYSRQRIERNPELSRIVPLLK